jgi:hypothetical protein
VLCVEVAGELWLVGAGAVDVAGDAATTAAGWAAVLATPERATVEERLATA